jgi:hypothetical protein
MNFTFVSFLVNTSLQDCITLQLELKKYLGGKESFEIIIKLGSTS